MPDARVPRRFLLLSLVLTTLLALSWPGLVSAQEEVVIGYIVEADSVYQASGEESLSAYIQGHGALVGAAVGTLLEIGFEVGMQGDAASETENLEFAQLVARLHASAGGSGGPLDYVDRYQGWSPEQREEKLRAQGLEAESVAARSAGDHELALTRLDEAAAIYEALGDTRALAVLWGSRGVVQFYRGDFAAMEDAYAHALPLRREIDDRILQGKTLNGMGSVCLKTDRYAEALDWYTQAVELRRSTGDLGGLITSLTYRGNAQYFMGDLAAAAESYDEAGSLLLGMGEAGDLQRADLLNSQANVREEMGDLDGALEAYRNAAELNEQLGMSGKAMLARCNRAKVLQSRGRLREAMTELSRAEQLLETTSSADPSLSLVFYQMRSEIYWQAGDLEAARDDLLEARRLAKESELVAEELNVALGLCRLYCKLGAADRALDMAVRAAEAAEASELPLLERDAWYELGTAALLVEDPTRAMEAFHRANAMDEARGAHSRALESRRGVATALAQLGRYPEARQEYDEILVQAAASEQLLPQVIAQVGLAHTYEDEDPARARKHYAQALELLERMRSEAGGLAATTFFVSETGHWYQEIARYYADQHAAHPGGDWADEAFRVVESSKSRGLLDAIEAEKTEIVTLTRVKAALPENALLLQYAVGDSASLLWAVGRDRVQLVELAPSEELRTQVERVRTAIATPGSGDAVLLEGCRKLYELLLAPVESQLEAAQALVVVPDGTLYLLPFEVLLTEPPAEDASFEDLAFLGRGRAISYAPSSSVWLRLRTEETRPSESTLLALGAPDFSTLEGERLEPLPHATQELQRVSARVDPSACRVLLGREASETALRRELALRHPRILHLATHGLVDPIEPERSCVVLSADEGNDGYLHSAEIADLQPAAALVVLSACETATGRFRRGEGVVGLGRSFLASGTHGVVASLWPVSDESTARLMDAFYEKLVDGEGAAASLEAAHEALRAHPETAHPFHWAGFILVGDAAAPWGAN